MKHEGATVVTPNVGSSPSRPPQVPNMPPRWPEIASYAAPKHFQDGPRPPQHGPNDAPRHANIVLGGPGGPQDGIKMTPGGPRSATGEPKSALLMPKTIPRRHQEGPQTGRASDLKPSQGRALSVPVLARSNMAV